MWIVTKRLACPMLSLLLWSLSATAQVYWDYKTANDAYDRGEFALAADMYRRLAADGHARAQTDLGFMYEVGDGVRRDAAKAATLYRKAADQGHGPAQFHLAVLYSVGRGVERKPVEALKWFSLASILIRNAENRIVARSHRDTMASELTKIHQAQAGNRACTWWRAHLRSGAKPRQTLPGCATE